MRFRAQVFDQLQLLYDLTGFNDHQLHCVLRFDSGPDAGILRKAVIASIEAIPILGTRYVEKGRRPHWESLDRTRYADAFTLARTEAEFDRFVTARIDERVGPQVGVCLLSSSRPGVALTMNHMVADAAGFKEYLYLLCEIYGGILADPAYRPAIIDGERSLRPILKRFSAGVKLKSLVSQGGENNRPSDHRFPLDGSEDPKPFIATRTLPRKSFEAIRDYSRTSGATLNDATLAAFYRCLFRRLDVSPGAELQIPVMVDMRRYLPAPVTFAALTNHSSTVITRLTYRPEESFASTLERVKAVIDEKKGGDIGLNVFIKLGLAYGLFPGRTANRLVRASLKNPLISMTNVGVLDAGRMSFGDARPCDAFMCGSIKYKPHFQLAMSSYDGELTLHSNLYGDATDKARVLSFLEDVERELSAPAGGREETP